MWITFITEAEPEAYLWNMSRFFTWQITRLNGNMCKAILLDSKKHTIILYYYSMFSHHKGGMVYILERITGSQERHICSIHASTPILSSIPSSTKPWKINVFRYFNITKNHLIPPKIPSNPYKIRFPSNSTENTIYNKEITLQNQLIYNSKITQNTSKINTFTQHKIYKQYNSIEVTFFTSKFHIKNLTSNY